jgi:streptogramin lyase
MRGKRSRLVLVLALLAMPLLAAAPARAYVYWADIANNTIGRANNDGTGVDDAFIHTGEAPIAVAVDSAHIYWANQNAGSIGRANLDGTAVDNSFITGISTPSGVAVNSHYVYWASNGEQRIGRASLDGLSREPNLVAAESPCAVALDSGHVYWTSATLVPEHVGRASLNGAEAQQWVTINSPSPCGLAVNSANIFWDGFGIFGFNGTTIGRANTSTGGGVDNSLIGDASGPCGLTIDSTGHLWWANAANGTIGRARTDATEVDESFIATGGQEICGVAVDNLAPAPTPTPSPSPTPEPTPEPTPAPPTSQLHLGRVALNPKRGTATLTATVGGTGSLSLAGKGIAKVRKTVQRAGSLKLTVKASGSAAKTLHERDRARVKALVTFAQRGDTPVTLAKKIALKLAPQR